MIYIMSTIKSVTATGMHSYKGFDTSTESLIAMRDDILKCIIQNTQIQVVNASIQRGNIVIKDWGNGIAYEKSTITGSKITTKHSGPKYTLFAKEDSVFKVVDKEGTIMNISEERLKSISKAGLMANCSIIQTKDGIELKIEDYYTIQKDIEFEKDIKTKYNNFIVKAAILGYKDINFKYTIENHEIKLTKYTGSSEDIILPSFITAIKNNAFERIKINTIKLNEGLRTIGSGAFSFSEIERIEIPSTVEIIGWGAFSHNIKLIKNFFEMNTDRFILRNDKTVVLDQSN